LTVSDLDSLLHEVLLELTGRPVGRRYRDLRTQGVVEAQQTKRRREAVERDINGCRTKRLSSSASKHFAQDGF
jgi:hypothetical protein